MWKSLIRRLDPSPAPGTTAPVEESAEPAKPFAVRMREAFEELRWTARRSGAALPVAALPQLGRIEDVLRPLLDHLEAHPPSVDEEIAIEALLGDYLPTALGSYVSMNRDFALRAGDDGRTPGDDLLDQLVVLETAAYDLSAAVYSHDAQSLATHGRFLSTKFSGSDLDL